MIPGELFTRLVPSFHLEVLTYRRHQSLVVAFRMPDGESFVVDKVLFQTWVVLDLLEEKCFQDVIFGDLSHACESHFPVRQERS